MNIKQILLSLLFAMVAFTSMAGASSHDAGAATQESVKQKEYTPKSIGELMGSFWETTGIKAILDVNDGEMTSER